MPVSGGNNRGLGSADEERQREISRDSGDTARADRGGDEERAINPTRENGGTSRTATQSSQGSARRSGKSLRGFASMNPERQREIASKGGRAAHAKGTAHEWTSDEARVAGRKGGEAVSRDRAHMAQIGREGGEARGKAARSGGNGQQRSGGSMGGGMGGEQRPDDNRADNRA